MQISSRQRSFSTQAIVVKRHSTGETDRIVTLLTESHGKLVCVAKGARKLNSSKRPLLEPGCLIQAFLVNTKSLPLLTQARLIENWTQSRADLPRIKRLVQILEIVDRLFTENEEDNQLFLEVREIIRELNLPQPASKKIGTRLNSIITSLGYQSLQDSPHENFLDYVANLSDRPMKSWQFLTVKS